MRFVLQGTLGHKAIGLEAPYIEGLADALSGLCSGSLSHCEATSCVIEGTSRQDPRSVHPAWHLAMQRIATAHGLFEASASIRRAAIASALALAAPSAATDGVLEIGMRAATDSFDLNEGARLRRRHRAPLPAPIESDIGVIDAYVTLMSDGLTSTVESLPAGWSRLVRDRTVAIVGPAKPMRRYGREIDAHDLIVRMNYHGSQGLPDSVFVGSRTDLSYYSTNSARSFDARSGHSGGRFLDELHFSVFKRMPSDPSFQRPNQRVAISPRAAILTGGPNLVPVALFDLLLSGVASVSLYNVDFYASARPYFEGYSKALAATDFEARPPLSQCLAMAHHDAASQFNFVRNLYRTNGRIDADGTASQVLHLSTRDYLRVLDQNFGVVAR